MDGKPEDAGYVIVIPEPADLMEFVEDIRELLRSLDTEVSGYRPRSALIDLPEEGGLEYLYHLTRARVEKKEIKYSLTAVEIYHLERQGNNIRTLASERIIPDKNILRNYEALQKQFPMNPLYKSIRLKNLLSVKTWYAGMDSLFNQYPFSFFVQLAGKTPTNIQFFGRDVKRKFKDIENNIRALNRGNTMSEEIFKDQMALSVYRLIREYVHRRSEEKSGKKYDDFKKNKNDKDYVIYPTDYREACEKVCSDAFLAMRGRRDKAFIEYFTCTIFSVPQDLPQDKKRDNYLTVSRALITDWETVKALAMLALSACSYLPKEPKAEGDKQ